MSCTCNGLGPHEGTARTLSRQDAGVQGSVADVLLLFPAFTTAFLLLSGLELISFASVQQHGSFCSSSIKMLHFGAGITMHAGPSLDMGLPGASGQGLPAQGMSYCFETFCI